MFKIIALNDKNEVITRATVGCTAENFAERLEVCKGRAKSAITWQVIDGDGNDVSKKFFGKPVKVKDENRGKITAITFNKMKSGKAFTRAALYTEIHALDPNKSEQVIWNTIGALMSTLAKKYGFTKSVRKIVDENGKGVNEFSFAA